MLTRASLLECWALILDNEVTLARKVAASTARKWRNVDRDDLTSELILWLYEHADHVARYRDGAEPALYVALRREASKWCARETREVTGRPLDYGAEYTTEQVERALPYVWEETPATLARDGVNVSAHSEALAVMSDFKNAYNDQPSEVQQILTLRYRDGLTTRDIASLLGVSHVSVAKRLKRAVERVRRTLCGS